MAATVSLAFCLDESMGRNLADVLRRLRAPASPAIHDLRELGFSGASDEIWMFELGRRGIHAVVTCDSRILRATVRRDVWRAAGLSLFIMAAKWSDVRLFDQARGLIWWWPAIVGRRKLGPKAAHGRSHST
jgi:hypothetical protein